MTAETTIPLEPGTVIDVCGHAPDGLGPGRFVLVGLARTGSGARATTLAVLRPATSTGRCCYLVLRHGARANPTETAHAQHAQARHAKARPARGRGRQVDLRPLSLAQG